MSTFIIAIFCLTTSYLLCFMGLIFQVPMQYFSLQHQTLLSPPDTSTRGHYIHFGSTSWFFLELFLHSSPVAYWIPPDLGDYLSVSYIFAFSYCSWCSQGKNAEVVCLSLLKSTTFCQKSPTMTCPNWVALHGIAYSFIELHKAMINVIILFTSLWLWFPYCLTSDGLR